MGNYLDFRSSSVSKERDKQPPPLNIPYKQSGVLSVDPRSPSEGIVRTPIQIDKGDPRSPSAGVVRTPLGFSTKLTVLTEDDSIHRGDTEGDKASSLSDTEVTNSLKNRRESGFHFGPTVVLCQYLTGTYNILYFQAHERGSNHQVRLSWLEKRMKRKSLNDSPGLFVRFRCKQNYEKHKMQQQDCGDSVGHSTESPK
ncbi:unnamed protein product [Trichobilharzia regenti]|nr:unnamed protein product [Trichobilharzia regenti]